MDDDNFKQEIENQFAPYEQIINEDKEVIHKAFEELSETRKKSAGMDKLFDSKILARDYSIEKLKGRRDQLEGANKTRKEIHKSLMDGKRELQDKIDKEENRTKYFEFTESKNRHQKNIDENNKKIEENEAKFLMFTHAISFNKFDEHIAIYDSAIEIKESRPKDGGKRKRKTLKKKFKKSKKNKNKRKSRKY